MSANILYYLAFSHMLGIGPVKFEKLLAHYKSPRAAYEADEGELKKHLGPRLGEQFIQFRKTFDPAKKSAEIAKKHIHILTREDQGYPEQLQHIPDPPICLYVRGNVRLLSRPMEECFAIVGTRRATSYGAHIATQFAAQLASYGFVIISGMALGIDAAAHRGTLAAGGLTVAVLGCGVDIIYPRSNSTLYQSIIKNQGAIVSEFPPGMTVLRGLFVARNRIISGLSRGVLVAEGAKDSGSLITARFAGEQGRDVFAPPSPITSQLSAAPNRLIKEGAKLVTSTDDILEEYNVHIKTQDRADLLKKLDGLEREIVQLILNEPFSADDLSERLKHSIDQILNSLTTLEIEGIVAKNEEGKYYKR